MPKLKMEALNHLSRSFNSFHNEAKNQCIYPVVLYATEVYTVLPNLSSDVSVGNFFHLAKTFLEILFSLTRLKAIHPIL